MILIVQRHRRDDCFDYILYIEFIDLTRLSFWIFELTEFVKKHYSHSNYNSEKKIKGC